MYIGERIRASDELGQPEVVYEHALLTVVRAELSHNRLPTFQIRLHACEHALRSP